MHDMSVVRQIDETDYVILKCVRDEGRALWKNKIHDLIVERQEELPIVDSVSVQTVGRRVDTLAEEGYLETGIITADEIQRDLIIGFNITEKGRQAIEEKRDELLKQTVQENLFTEHKSVPMGASALAALIAEEFELSESSRNHLEESYTEAELITLLSMHYMEREAMQFFDRDEFMRFAQRGVEKQDTFRSVTEQVPVED